MALTDSSLPAEKAFQRAKISRAAPQDWLARLPRLYDESRHNLDLGTFLAATPRAALFLMLAGTVTVALGSNTLTAQFTWSTLMLVGIAAMVRACIRSYARSFRRLPLEAAAEDVRILLLYCGAVWGAGAFLVLPPQPAPLAACMFALLPALGLALLLRDEIGVVAFAVPAILIAAGAGLVESWGDGGWIAALLVALGVAIVRIPALRRARSEQLHLPEK